MALFASLVTIHTSTLMFLYTIDNIYDKLWQPALLHCFQCQFIGTFALNILQV